MREIPQASLHSEEIAKEFSARESSEGDQPSEARDLDPVEARRGRQMFKFYPSRLTCEDLSGLGIQYHFPRGCRLMEPAPTDHAATPPKGFVAISIQHLEAGLRFLVPSYLIELLNDLRLAPGQLTSNCTPSCIPWRSSLGSTVSIFQLLEL